MTSQPFPDTRWSVVARSRTGAAPAARRALGELCEAYWRPLLAFARRTGANEHDALDQVQAFCARLLERGGVGAADAARGRFRSYLLGAFRHFVANDARGRAAAKRGGAMPAWSWDDTGDDAVPAAADTPERAFERRWALAVLARATARLHAEHESPPKRRLLAALEPALLESTPAPRTVAVAEALGATEGAVRVALHRLRVRLRELIRDEVAQTVADPTAVDDELRELQRALGR